MYVNIHILYTNQKGLIIGINNFIDLCFVCVNAAAFTDDLKLKYHDLEVTENA